MYGELIPPHCSDPMFLQDLAMSGQPLPPECQSAPSMWDLLGNLFSPGKQSIRQGGVNVNEVGPIDCEWEWGDWAEWTDWKPNASGDGEYRERKRQRIQTVVAEYGGNDCSGDPHEIEIETRSLTIDETPADSTGGEVGGEDDTVSETGESDEDEEIVEESRWDVWISKARKGLMYVGGLTVAGVGIYIYSKQKR
jgi:hypothetical protein